MSNILNTKWKELQESKRYSDVLKKIQRIVISTNLNNRFVYAKLCENHPDYDINEPNRWFGNKNGNLIKDTDDNGNIIGTKYVKIDVLDDILTPFFENIDPVTKMPIEIPIDVQLR